MPTFKELYEEELRKSAIRNRNPNAGATFLDLWKTRDNPRQRTKVILKREGQRQQINSAIESLERRRNQPASTPDRPGFIEGIVSDVTGAAERVGRGISRSLGADDDLEEAARAQDVQTDLLVRVSQRLRSKDITPKARKHYEKLLKELQKDKSPAEAITKVSQEIQDDADKRKFIGAVGLLGSFFVPAGSVGVAAKGIKSAAASRSAGQLIKSAAPTTGLGAVAGGTGGAGITALEDEASAGDIIRGGVIGAGFGAGIGFGLPAAGAAGRRLQETQRVKSLDDAVRRISSTNIDRVLATTVGQKALHTAQQVQKKLQNTTTPINRELDRLVKRGKITEIEAKLVKSQIQTSRYSAKSLSESFIKGDKSQLAEGSRFSKKLYSPLHGKVLDPDKPKKHKAFFDYWSAKGELEQMRGQSAQGKKVSAKRREQLKARVDKLETPEYLERFNASVGVYEELADLMVKHNIVSQQTVNAWRSKNQLYNRIQREVDGLSEAKPPGVGGKAPASRGASVSEQKVKGSNKKVINPALTLQDYSDRVFQEITSNEAATSLIEALRKGGVLNKPLRSAENVAMRRELQDALKHSRPLKKQLVRYSKSQSKYLRRIQNELNKLNRAGLRESVKRPAVDENLAGKLADPGASLNKQELQSVLENIVQDVDTKALRSIRKKIAKRDPKLAEAIEELEDIQINLDAVNAERQSQYQEILKRADDRVNRKPTIQRRVNGIKEIYETTPDIELAAKGMGPVYLGAFGRIISAPVRFLQTTITGGLNPAWAPLAITRDFIEGVVLSRRARQTHNPMNIIGSLSEGAKYLRKGSNDDMNELFTKFISSERGASSIIDLTRAAKSNARNIREVSRRELPKVQKAARVITKPKDFYGVIQDAAKWNDYAAKYMNFRGHYNKLIKEGVDKETAFNVALFEARQATANLLESGDWTRALSAVYPYFNPTVQGGASLAKAFKERPVSASAKLVTAVQMPAAIATAWNMSDPRRAEIYLDINPNEREKYNIIVLPGTLKTGGKWSVIKIPKPPGVGSLANPVERMMVGMYGEDPGEFENIAQSIIKSLGSPISPDSFSGAVGSAIPFQLKPGVQTAANFNFYSGKEIVPDWLKEENPDEPYKQDYDETSSTFKKIGKALNISPLIVKSFAQDTTGEFGRNALWLSDVTLDLADAGEGGVGGRSPLESVTKSYFGAFGGVKQRQLRDRLDTTLSKKPGISREITAAVKADDLGRASELARQYNSTVDALNRAATENEEFAKLTDAQKKLLEDLKFPMDDEQLSQGSIDYRRSR